MKKATIALLLICTAAFAQQKGSFNDKRDKKTYKTVKIGEQTWMAENLNYAVEGSKCYGEGGVISEGESGEEKITYTNKEVQANCKKYGRLYNWATAMKACPDGWHLPSDKEWQTLVDVAGGNEAAGKKLKAKSGWSHNGNGTDSYGFSALPGALGNSDGPVGMAGGNSHYLGFSGSWWSASNYEDENLSNYACFRTMQCIDDIVGRSGDDKSTSLYSVRCVKD